MMRLQEPHDSHYNPHSLCARNSLTTISVFGVNYALE
jgi:hypothetical protein